MEESTVKVAKTQTQETAPVEFANVSFPTTFHLLCSTRIKVKHYLPVFQDFYTFFFAEFKSIS